MSEPITDFQSYARALARIDEFVQTSASGGVTTEIKELADQVAKYEADELAHLKTRGLRKIGDSKDGV